jgi:hypothetical protein
MHNIITYLQSKTKYTDVGNLPHVYELGGNIRITMLCIKIEISTHLGIMGEKSSQTPCPSSYM